MAPPAFPFAPFARFPFFLGYPSSFPPLCAPFHRVTDGTRCGTGSCRDLSRGMAVSSHDLSSGSSFRSVRSRPSPIAHHYPQFPRHFSVTRAISSLFSRFPPSPQSPMPSPPLFPRVILSLYVCTLAVCSLFRSFGPRKYHLPPPPTLSSKHGRSFIRETDGPKKIFETLARLEIFRHP